MKEQKDWSQMTPEERKTRLFAEQKSTLDAFLERGAISISQYNKSLGDLILKMGIDPGSIEQN